MIFKIVTTPVLKSPDTYNQPQYAPYQHLVKSYFAKKAAVWELTAVIAQGIGSSSNTVTLSTLPHLDDCLQTPLAVFPTPHGSQGYNAVLYAPPNHQQQYAGELENGKCFRALFTAQLHVPFSVGRNKERAVTIDSVGKVPNAAGELPFRYRILVSSANKVLPGSKLQVSLDIQTPEGVRQPPGFLEPLANRWVSTAYKEVASVVLP